MVHTDELGERAVPIAAGYDPGTGTTQQVLRRLVMVIGAMGFAIRNLSGADRGQLKGIEAELTEIGQLLGMFPSEIVEKPTSAWPEGEGRE